MKHSPVHILSIVILFATSVWAQQSGRPVAIVVDQIGGRFAPIRASVKNERTSTGSRSSYAFETERRAFDLTNAARQANGLRALVWDEELAELARAHTLNMAEHKFFSHKNAVGEMVDGRAKQAGIRWVGIGENIATMRGYEDTATVAVENWMRSTGHKRNILNGQFQLSAIGVVIADDGTTYFTQVFVMR